MPHTDVPATPEKTAPPPERFGLNRPRARIWLHCAVAWHMADYYGKKPPAGPVAEPDVDLPEIGEDWSPRTAERPQAFQLVRGAVDAGIIRTPPFVGLDFEILSDEEGDCYQFRIYVGPDRRLTLVSYTEEMRRLGEPNVTGVAAALSVLEEAVAAANQVLDDLDKYVADRGGDPTALSANSAPWRTIRTHATSNGHTMEMRYAAFGVGPARCHFWKVYRNGQQVGSAYLPDDAKVAFAIACDEAEDLPRDV